MGNFEKGSEWRIWDLHVHTSASYDYQYKSTDADEKLVEAWKSHNIKAVAITDHFLINSERIKNLRELAPEMLILPGVELRTDKGGANIHVIGIFPENNENLDRLNQSFTYNLLPKAKSKDNVESIYWDFKDIVEFIGSENGILTTHAGSKSNGIDSEIHTSTEDPYKYIKYAIKDEYAQNVHIFEVGNMKSYRAYQERIFPRIGVRPLIICSDNHNPNNYTRNENLWIKGDLSFNGLMQAIEHPEERIFVGNKPPKVLHEETQAQYIIDSIEIRKNENPKNTAKWFDTRLELNSSLVAIIGNKGSGKSALSDVFGLIGDSNNIVECSFLTKDRFNKSPEKYGEDYNVEISWLDGHEEKKNSLVCEFNPQEKPDKIQYLPQKYIEKVCSNLGDTFQEEINRVLYSYINLETRGVAKNFNELIEIKTRPIKVEINRLKERLDSINTKIISLEDKMKNSYRISVNNAFESLNDTLERHIQSIPKEISKPNTEEDLEKEKEIQEFDRRIEQIASLIQGKKNEIYDFNRRIDTFNELRALVNKEVRNIDSLNSAITSSLEMEGAVEDFQLSYTSPLEKYNEIIIQLEALKNVAANYLVSGITDSLVDELDKVKSNKSLLVEESSKNIREYQEYLVLLETWTKQRDDIIGDEQKEGSIEYLTKERDYLNSIIGNDMQILIQQREDTIKEIYSKKNETVEVFNELYRPVHIELKRILEAVDDNIEFSAILNIDMKIGDGILELVNKQYTGIFNGKEESYKLVRGLITDLDATDSDNIIEFINKILRCGIPDGIDKFDKMEKIIKNKDIFYNKLCSLDYIDVEFGLTLQGRPLEELSPGERGLVLLIFYLALSNNKQPIIIDQPEDNLDNQSIYTKLVPCILEAKKNRQVIIVTHNPNIAIACDAEQIIIANINKSSLEISYKSGSIENEDINKDIVDILEGTVPAFNLRERKYLFPVS